MAHHFIFDEADNDADDTVWEDDDAIGGEDEKLEPGASSMETMKSQIYDAEATLRDIEDIRKSKVLYLMIFLTLAGLITVGNFR